MFLKTSNFFYDNDFNKIQVNVDDEPALSLTVPSNDGKDCTIYLSQDIAGKLSKLLFQFSKTGSIVSDGFSYTLNPFMQIHSRQISTTLDVIKKYGSLEEFFKEKLDEFEKENK